MMLPTRQDYLLELLHHRLEHNQLAAIADWRNQIGQALADWDLVLAERLIAELARHPLSTEGQANLRRGQAALFSTVAGRQVNRLILSAAQSLVEHHQMEIVRELCSQIIETCNERIREQHPEALGGFALILRELEKKTSELVSPDQISFTLASDPGFLPGLDPHIVWKEKRSSP